MKTTRRNFVKTAAGVSLGAAASGLLPKRIRAAEAPAILPIKNPNSKIQIAIVGLGGISGGHIIGVSRDEHLVALCECRKAALDAKVAWIKTLDTLNVKPEDMKKFLDYREMLEAMGDRLDAVIVCTPDHNHAIIGMDAMKRGKHIFIEKPMAYSIHEAIALREAARKYRVASQMGNEGHSWHVTPLAVEYLWSGAIGPVREVYHWCVGRSIGGDDTGMRAEPMKFIPEHHRLWSVPLPEEEAYVTYVGGTSTDPLAKPEWGWHGDRRYANGSLGDWAPHTMDVAYWGLKIAAAATCKIEMPLRLYGGDKLHYKTEVFKWTIPARADMPELTQYWYSGVRPNTNPEIKDDAGKMRLSVPNMPPKVVEVMEKYGRRFDEFGTLYVGENGYMHTAGCGGGGLRFIPEELNRSIPRPPETLPRAKAKGDNNGEWYHAIRTGERSTASFEYSSGFTEHYLSGVLASLVPLGTAVEYDRVNHKVTNIPELNQYVTRKYRKGYEIV